MAALFNSFRNAAISTTKSFLPGENDGDHEWDTYVAQRLRNYYTEDKKKYMDDIEEAERLNRRCKQRIPEFERPGISETSLSFMDPSAIKAPTEVIYSTPKSNYGVVTPEGGRPLAQARPSPFARNQNGQQAAPVQARPLPSSRNQTYQNVAPAPMSAKDKLKARQGARRVASPANSAPALGPRGYSNGSGSSNGTSYNDNYSSQYSSRTDTPTSGFSAVSGPMPDMFDDYNPSFDASLNASSSRTPNPPSRMGLPARPGRSRY
jgi:hypothetical protein